MTGVGGQEEIVCRVLWSASFFVQWSGALGIYNRIMSHLSDNIEGPHTLEPETVDRHTQHHPTPTLTLPTDFYTQS